MRNSSKYEYKFWHLIAGLLLGFFLGSGIVYLNFNRQNVSSYAKNFLNKFSNNKTKTPDVVKNKQNNQDNDNGVSRETSTYPAQYQNSSVDLSISEKNAAKPGIIKDSLISAKTIYLELNNNYRSKPLEELDSILGNVKSRRHLADNLFLLEFWESPINFQAYKRSKNKITFYGVNYNEINSFEVFNKNIYMRYYNDFYLIEESNEFKDLNPITDLLLINKIENSWE